MKAIKFLIAVCLVVFNSNTFAQTSIRIGDTLPTLQVSNLLKSDHPPITTKQLYQSGTLIINFWATWCPPCRAEMPLLLQMADLYGDKFVLQLEAQLADRNVTIELSDEAKVFGIIDEVFDKRIGDVSGRGKLAADMREIWVMQPRFEKRVGNTPYGMVMQPRFRAGFRAGLDAERRVDGPPEALAGVTPARGLLDQAEPGQCPQVIAGRARREPGHLGALGRRGAGPERTQVLQDGHPRRVRQCPHHPGIGDRHSPSPCPCLRHSPMISPRRRFCLLPHR